MTNFEKFVKDEKTLAEVLVRINKCCYRCAVIVHEESSPKYPCRLCPLKNVSNCGNSESVESWLREEAKEQTDETH